MCVCCSQLLRLGFVVVAAPLLFTGTVFHQISHRLQLSGFNNAEYATAELVTATALDRQAKQSTAQAEEDQALVTELEADATRHGEEVGANEAVAGEQAAAVGGDELTAAGEAGTAAAVEAVPGVNVAADVAEGTAIAGEEVSAVGSAFNALKSEAFALEEGGQATADANLAAEKEAEADSLTVAATVEEGASVASKRQAAKSAVLAGGFFVEAFVCQLVAAVFQLPVVVLLATKKLSTLSVGACGAGACVGTSSASWIVSRLSLVATVGSFVAIPWASTVLVASGGPDLMSEVEAVTGSGGSSRSLKAKHNEPSFLNGLNPFAKPNTATTTVRITTPEPPTRETHLETVIVATGAVLKHFAKWARPVLMDIGVVSLAFAVAGFAFSAGKHVPSVRKGALSHRIAAGKVLRDVIDHWLWGFAILVALWILSITMAKELQPFARHVQHVRFGILAWACTILALLCFAANTFHGSMNAYVEPQEDEKKTESKRLLADESDRSRVSERSDIEREVAVADLEAAQESEYGGNTRVKARAIASCLCATFAASFEPLLQAAEGPINAW
eukprot:CAMPEP_0169097516 /NCGR_PEP_ID=MMETSP1015-20121227/19561_1 /TAXON_ID=342587 /ORGANISM="Karlodinium micrum, Strain CCMP2283" /LENGTH=561 /DNA_ID=CAMNT_0009158327 /DNA_START=55 /DNA_END=1737 /DNA_ORIENTATION=+